MWQGVEKKTKAQQKRAYGLLVRDPSITILTCRLTRDITVVRVDVPNPHEGIPEMIASDKQKERFVATSPDYIDGMLICISQRDAPDEEKYTYCELLLKASVAKTCYYTRQSPSCTELPFDMKDEYAVVKDFVIPKDTRLYHAPKQTGFGSPAERNATGKAIIGDPAFTNIRYLGTNRIDPVVYFGLRPSECFARYNDYIRGRKRAREDKAFEILQKVGRNRQFERKLGMS